VALELRRGRVTAVTERVAGLVRLEVEGRACVAYPRLTGPVALGDDVVVNTQALELGLGSGGFDLLHVNLTRGLGLGPEPGAHVMKLPYTSLQHAVVHCEETGPAVAPSLDGLPVVCCTLHSQVAPVCAGIGRDLRVAYVQLPGGSLPVSLSDAVRVLKDRTFLEMAVAVGSCVDGDVACVTAASALQWCAASGYEAVVCAVGPGIVGTGSRFGHGGLAAAEAIVAARALGGRSILAVRASEVDPRPRHVGVSHHAAAVFALVGEVETAWPAARGDRDRPEELESARLVATEGWREACAGLPLSHMGRGPDEDELFFESAFAAGRLVHELRS
jgi:Protein of unknown function (DUF3866)